MRGERQTLSIADGGEGFTHKSDAEQLAAELRQDGKWARITPATLRDRLPAQFHWVVRYGPKRRNNPGGRKLTKLQKKVRAAKKSADRRVALALAKYLKQVNPAMKTAGAKVQKLAGGVLKITPIKANRARSRR